MLKNFDNIIMDYKLKLRAISKPGNDLWEACEELDNGSDMQLVSESKDGVYTFELILGIYQHQHIVKEFIAFDDYGEWEFREATRSIKC